MPTENVKVKCDNCGWQGDYSELVPGIVKLTEDILFCPKCETDEWHEMWWEDMYADIEFFDDDGIEPLTDWCD